MWRHALPSPSSPVGNVAVRNQIDMTNFPRMLAKIALGVTTATFRRRFRPLVRGVILGEDPTPGQFVGGLPAMFGPSPDNHLHWWGWDVQTAADGVKYLTCTLRLFTGLGAPAYSIWVGDEIGDLTAEEITDIVAKMDTGGASSSKLSVGADGVTWTPIRPIRP